MRHGARGHRRLRRGAEPRRHRSGRHAHDLLEPAAPGPARRPGARASSTPRSSRCARPAAGSGDFKVNFASARRRDRGRRHASAGIPDKTAENARKAVENTRTIAYIGELRLRRDGDLAPDHERGRVRAGEPGVDGGRPDEARARSGEGRAGQVLPLRRRAPSRASSRPTTCRPRRRRGWTRSLGARTRVPARRQERSRATASWSCTGRSRQEVGLRDRGRRTAWTRAPTTTATSPREVAKAQPGRRLLRRRRGQQRGAALARPATTRCPTALLIGVAATCSCRRSTTGSGAAERRTYITSVAQDPSQLPAARAALRARLPARVRRAARPVRGLRPRGDVAAARRDRARRRRGGRARTRGRGGARHDGLRQRRRARSRSTTTATRRWSGRRVPRARAGGWCSPRRCAGAAGGLSGLSAPAEALHARGRGRLQRRALARETPARRASSATACATASATRRSKTLGMM